MKANVILVLCTLISFSAISQQAPVAVETVIQLETVVTENPPSISFSWNEIEGDFGVYIYRRSAGSATWVKIESLPEHISEYTDNNVQIGEKYEYRIKSLKPGYIPIETYVSAGIRCKETEYRGKIILLVDSIFVNPLEVELSRLESDFIGDGWEVIRKNVSRNLSVKQVKNIIREIYFRDLKNIKTVFLIGHIPVPYSGETAFDAHNNHQGAWPADIYYGDVNETFWTDSKVNNTNSKNTDNYNVPGDGKFDLSTLPEYETVMLAIGRVDFFDLPAFSQGEVELMRNYLNKDYAYRHKMIHPKMQGLVDDNLPPLPITVWGGDTTGYELISLSGWRNFTALFNFENIDTGKVFQNAIDDSYIWTYGCGWGTDTSCLKLGSVTDFVTKAPKTVFTAFYGSWFGDWNTKNNFLRSALASSGWMLTSCWPGRPHYVFHQMGMGETIGSCIQRTQNNSNTYEGGSFKRAINISLMGDPTLRMHVVSPVQSLHSEINENNSIDLSWDPPDDKIIGYYIYRLDTTTNNYKRLNSEIVNDTFYTDVLPRQGNNYYMVRGLQLTQSASGSYYNLSQGVFDTVQYVTDVSDISIKNENVLIYPNPTSNVLNIETGIPDICNIKITSINGQLLLNKVMVGPDYELDLSHFKSGIYFITVRSKDFMATRKIVKL